MVETGKVQEPAPLINQISRLEEKVAKLGELVSNVINRLQPVSTPVPKGGDKKARTIQAGSPVTARIIEMDDQLETIIDSLVFARDQLEI
jgi:hypothetical protein